MKYLVEIDFTEEANPDFIIGKFFGENKELIKDLNLIELPRKENPCTP